MDIVDHLGKFYCRNGWSVVKGDQDTGEKDGKGVKLVTGPSG